MQVRRPQKRDTGSLLTRLAGTLFRTVAASFVFFASGCRPPEQVASSVDHATLIGKNIVGYQGWFGCPPIDNGWMHWFLGSPTQHNLTVDFWPDTSDMDSDELCRTGWRDGSDRPISAYSSANSKTVARHFRWMQTYHIDGAAAQRFVSVAVTPWGMTVTDKVLHQIANAAEQTGRVFFVYYDISGADSRKWNAQLLADWQRINQQMNVTKSSAYLYHRGLPVVGVWGLGFTDRPGTPTEASQLIAALKAGGHGAPRATVIGGIPSYWRTLNADSKTDPAWLQAYHEFDVISPWMVGRFLNSSEADRFYSGIVQADLRDAESRRIDYLPVVFPGFSDANLQSVLGHPRAQNLAPRACGKFYQHQVDLARRNGARMLYTAMFDEVDEGTAVYKVMPTKNQLPVGITLVSLDADGCSLPSDYYLRLSGYAADALKGIKIPSALLPR
jgi:hypothetical protein